MPNVYEKHVTQIQCPGAEVTFEVTRYSEGASIVEFEVQSDNGTESFDLTLADAQALSAALAG